MNALPLLAQITVFSAILYLALLLFRKLFAGRISSSLQYGLWFLLMLRLMIPVTIESQYKLITLPAQTAHAMIPLRAIKAVSPAGPGAWNWDLILTAVWLAGMAISFGWLLFVYVHLSRDISRKGAPPDEATRAVLEKVKADLGIRHGPKVLFMPGISTPALTVGFTPKLLLPFSSDHRPMKEEELEYVLRHELMHYKRGDHAVCLVLAVLRCVYWFNPVVWLAVPQIKLDMEISCDNLAVRKMNPEGKKQYASMILAMFGGPQKPRLVMGFSPENNRANVENRIRGVFMNTKSMKSSLIAAAIAVLLLSAACFTTACVPTVKTNPPPAAITAAATPSPAGVPSATPAPKEVAVHDCLGNILYYLEQNPDGSITVNNNNCPLLSTQDFVELAANDLTSRNLTIKYIESKPNGIVIIVSDGNASSGSENYNTGITSTTVTTTYP